MLTLNIFAANGMSKVLEKAGSNATGTMSKLAKFGAGTMQVGGQIAAVGKVFYHDSHSTNAMNIIDIIIIIQPWQSGRSGSGGCI